MLRLYGVSGVDRGHLPKEEEIPKSSAHWTKKMSSSDPVTGIPSFTLGARDFF